jgi:sugar lactone lactonase YvrE
MFQTNSRYPDAGPARVADGWRLERLTPASQLYSANGLRAGPDGRIYVAQVSGSQISALDLDTGRVEVVSPMGSDIVAPDDLDFDARGDLYATEYMDGRVAVRERSGATRVLRGDVPGANGISFHQGRLFVDECRLAGRLLELDLAGGAPRVLLQDIPLPNALSPGPDGQLYFPVMGADEIWRIDPDGGAPETVVGGLANPVAVKFDAQGFIVTPQGRSGEVLRIDPRNGARSVLASLDSGLDNLTFVGERLFVSHLSDGRITEVLGEGRTRTALAGGMQRPMGLCVGDDGRVYVADNGAFYVLDADGALHCLGRLFTPGYPGGARGVAAAGPGLLAVTTAGGRLVLYRPAAQEHAILAEGIDQPYGVAVTASGAMLVAEYGTGRVLAVAGGQTAVAAQGLDGPLGLALDADGSCLVGETGAGRISRIRGSGVETVADGLQRPQGLAVHGGRLYVLEAGAKQLVAIDLATGARAVLASGLPVGAPPGVTPKPLLGAPPFVGRLDPFAGLAVTADGTIHLGADGEGSILALRPDPA